jgi:hypothetical protein
MGGADILNLLSFYHLLLVFHPHSSSIHCYPMIPAYAPRFELESDGSPLMLCTISFTRIADVSYSVSQ